MDQEKIGKFIAERRKVKNLTQAQLAERLRVSDRSISNWENGKCLPDLSLFKPLCNELEITINELLSGEKIKKDEYQNKFEENVIDVVKKVEEKNKRYNSLKLLVFIFALLICLFIILKIICDNIYFYQKYDKENMYIEKMNDNGLRFVAKNSCSLYSGNVKHIITSIDNNKIIFVRVKCNISDLLSYKKEQNKKIDLTSNSYRYDNFDVSSLESYKIYYTNVSFNKIRKANNKKLKKIINESTLMYES